MIPFPVHTAAETPNAFQWAGQPKKLPISMAISTSSNTWFREPTLVSPSPNGMLTGSACFAGLTNVTDRQTDRRHYSIDHIVACK